MKKRADGRYVKTITDPKTHKRISYYGKSPREVNLKILQDEKKQEEGRTFAEVAYDWWAEWEPRLAVQSMSAYKPSLATAIRELGSYTISDITPKDIAKYMRNLASQGYAQKTISNRRIVINKIFEYAIIEGDIQYNPCSSVQLPTGLKKTVRGAASLTDEDKIKETNHAWLFPKIAIYTGLRKGEILALKWSDIDFEKEIIYITKSVGHDNSRPFIKTPKTEAGCRIVPLVKPLKALLKSQQKQPDQYIISDTGDSPLTEKRFQTLYRKYKEEVGITATAHQLRHSFATVCIEKGVDIKSVSEILGHKQISTTLDIYTEFRTVALENSRNALNSAFKAKNSD